jgi:hypothetical protein
MPLVSEEIPNYLCVFHQEKNVERDELSNFLKIWRQGEKIILEYFLFVCRCMMFHILKDTFYF